jgi:2OG-Fe(II) oxygenase superfamily
MNTRSKKAAVKTDASNAADVILRRRIHNGRRWSKWGIIFRRSDAERLPSPFVYPLERGGELHIYLDLLSPKEQQAVTEELKNNATLFREYGIQGGKEPRAHFLLHEKAPDGDIDDNSIKSPGYKYGNITMKARPFSHLIHLQQVSNKLKTIAKVKGWNIGTEVVAYRDGRDSIGFHADDDQGEKLIFTAPLFDPSKARRVVFKNKRMQKDGEQSKRPRDGDEEIELLLGAGDAYSMDGEFDNERDPNA